MGKGKDKSKTTQSQNTSFNNQAQYGWQQTPDTADTSALRSWKPQIDPGLASQYGRARNDLNSSFLNPIGGYTNASLQEKQRRTGMENLNQQEAQAFRGGQYDVNQQRLGQLGTLASLTAPRLTQTGSSGTGNMTGQSDTSQWHQPGVGDYISGALNIATMF